MNANLKRDFVAGTSYSAFRYGTFTTEDINHTDYMLYNGYGGIGMLDGFILDAHFRSVNNSRFC